MGLTKKDKKDIGEIVAVTISEYHNLDVKPEFEKIHKILAEHSGALANLDAKIESGLSDVNRRLTDLSMDTPNREESKKQDHRIQRLEHELGFV